MNNLAKRCNLDEEDFFPQPIKNGRIKNAYADWPRICFLSISPHWPAIDSSKICSNFSACLPRIWPKMTAFARECLTLYNGLFPEFFWTPCISSNLFDRKWPLLPENASQCISVYSLNFFKRHVSGDFFDRKWPLLPENASLCIAVHPLNFFERHVSLVTFSTENDSFCPKMPHFA